ncbi:TlpA family protein disulfide reductase [Plantactinospora sp. DSM 117369]
MTGPVLPTLPGHGRTRWFGAMRRPRLAALLGIAATVAVLAAGCTGDGGADPEPAPPVAGGAAALPGPVPGDLALRSAPTDLPAAPKVTGTLTDGSPLAVPDLWADRPVVLTFFSSWCNTCASRQDALSELARAHRDRVVFVGVAGADEPDALQEYLRRHRVEYPVLVDGDQRIGRAYAVREPPAVVVVAKGGTLLRGWPGGVDAPTLDSMLRKLVFAP